MDYCETADLYSYGLPRGSVPNPGRLVASVDISANTLTLGDHGLADGDVFTLRPEGSGSMPGPLVSGTRYYARDVTDDTWKAAATLDGTAIDLTTAGSRVLLIVPLPIAASIRWASNTLDQFIPAHAAPLDGEPIPVILRTTCAELATGKLLKMMGRNSKTIAAMLEDTAKIVARWSKGVPIRGENAPETHTNLARAATAPYCDRNGWNRYGGIG